MVALEQVAVVVWLQTLHPTLPLEMDDWKNPD